jgi:bisphosphoglycerate-independent phosphoglycerate mutase (AlkP superfamily)
LRDRGATGLVALVVLDGWGCSPPGPGNAVELAGTPVFDRLWAEHPHATLAASGEAVGLPEGQMGNSEVGHLTIGSGRILFQDLQRVNVAIRDGSFFENEALVGAFEAARETGGSVHLLGLVSHGGVHSHIDHLEALLELARRQEWVERTWIHAFTDGRDVSPISSVRDLAALPTAQIATVAGRYYAMDRDSRWERTDRAVAALLDGEGAHATSAIAAVEASYDHKPEMSAVEVAHRFCDEVGGGYAFAVVNFANPDMVGHTGVIPAVVEAVETTDACLGRVVHAVHAAGGVCLITADHGNAEQMLEPDGVSPHTAHTTNPVPLILTAEGMLRDDGELSDLAPTVLDLLGIPQPPEMTAKSLRILSQKTLLDS